MINMRYLCDTNILFQILRKRTYEKECLGFLSRHMAESAVTDFSVFSLCIRAVQRNDIDVTYRLLIGLLDDGFSILKTSNPEALAFLLEAKSYRFTYDDAVQVGMAKKHGLTLITLDQALLNAKLDIPILRPNQVK